MRGAAALWPMLGDLALERNPRAEQGLVVWAGLVVLFTVLTAWLVTRRHGLLGGGVRPGEASGLESKRGWPFMKRVLLGTGQVLSGMLLVYALAQATTPPVKRPAGWVMVLPDHDLSVLARQGELIWAGGKEGLFAVGRHTRRLVSQPRLQARDLRGVQALLAEGDTLWIGCRQGLFRYRQETLELLAPRPGFDLGPVSALCRARDGALWVGVQAGAWRVAPQSGRWQWFGRAEGLPLPSVDLIYQDREGNLWFGSNQPEAPGLFRADGQGQGFSNQSAGLVHHAINDLREDHTGTLWAATGFGTRGGAARFLKDQWLPLAEIPGLTGQKIRSVFEDSRRRFWFCSEYDGVALRNGAAWKRLTMQGGLPGTEVKQMLEEDGALWLATERGLGCLESHAASLL